MIKKIICIALVMAGAESLSGQRLIVRGDDIGANHAANVGVIRSYTDGIQRSAELMVVTPWLPEAVKMLKEHPGLDVGIHLALTSEWENMKWRPLTHAPSLVDEYGYFLTSTFPNPNYPGRSLMEVQVNPAEVEAELRAQIELGMKLLPGQITHLSGHMFWAIISDEVAEIGNRLAKEYGLPLVDDRGDTGKRLGLEGMNGGFGLPPQEREAKFIETLGTLEKGKTYVFVEHPAIGGDEMKAIWHIGYENVSEDRQGVVDLFTNPRVKEIIKERDIKLVSYGDVIRESKK